MSWQYVILVFNLNQSQFLGVCVDPLCIITSFCEEGSLFNLLQSKQEIPHKVLEKIVNGIVAGMLHLVFVLFG